MYCLIKWNVGEQRIDIKETQELVVVIIWLGPFCKTKRVLYGKLVGGDRLKNTYKIRELALVLTEETIGRKGLPDL